MYTLKPIAEIIYFIYFLYSFHSHNIVSFFSFSKFYFGNLIYFFFKLFYVVTKCIQSKIISSMMHNLMEYILLLLICF
jgi:hypothetical protein